MKINIKSYIKKIIFFCFVVFIEFLKKKFFFIKKIKIRLNQNINIKLIRNPNNFIFEDIIQN